MLHMPMPMRGNNRDYRQEMGTMRTSTTRKRGNIAFQQAGRKPSRHKRENTHRGLEGFTAHGSSQASSVCGNPSTSGVSSYKRRKRAHDVGGALDGLGRQKNQFDQAGILGCRILDSTVFPARSSSCAASLLKSETCFPIFSTYS